MREILFRGKRVDNGEWVYGDLINTPELKTRIIWYEDTSSGGVDSFKDFNYLVDKNTIGQFTGLLDKNGNKIFEGDLVRWTNGKHYWEAVISTLPNSKTNTLYAIETYCNLSTYFDEFDEEIYSFERTDERKGIRNELEFLSKNIEIIGNIHEKK